MPGCFLDLGYTAVKTTKALHLGRLHPSTDNKHVSKPRNNIILSNGGCFGENSEHDVKGVIQGGGAST